jgi:hypothetical protein
MLTQPEFELSELSVTPSMEQLIAELPPLKCALGEVPPLDPLFTNLKFERLE